MTLKHQASHARKWRVVARLARRHLPDTVPPVLFLTDPERTKSPEAVIDTLPPGFGVIYRHYGAPDRVSRAITLRQATRKRGLVLLVSADPQLAKAVGAEGVHWPEARLSEMRKWHGCFAIQTASAHSRRAVRAAEKAGADAALVSAIFPSKSPSAGRPIGPLTFARLAGSTRLPLFGLGGIHIGNAQQISRYAGLAAIDGLIK